MKPTQQQKDNKLIAKFMGLTIITDNISYFDTNYKPLKKYNEDWNWLMEVVEKIENLTDKDNFILYDFNIYSDAVMITDQQDNTLVIVNKSDGNFTTKIESVYIACLKFIKWYNEQNK